MKYNLVQDAAAPAMPAPPSPPTINPILIKQSHCSAQFYLLLLSMAIWENYNDKTIYCTLIINAYRDILTVHWGWYTSPTCCGGNHTHYIH